MPEQRQKRALDRLRVPFGFSDMTEQEERPPGTGTGDIQQTDHFMTLTCRLDPLNGPIDPILFSIPLPPADRSDQKVQFRIEDPPEKGRVARLDPLTQPRQEDMIEFQPLGFMNGHQLQTG